MIVYRKVFIVIILTILMVELNNLEGELKELDFVGGTLVEYQEGASFEVEFDRSKITRADISDDYICIDTDGEGCLEWNEGLSDGWKVNKRDDVFYMDNHMLYAYALAPKGIDIPQKPTCA
jgi:hypothetical protein